MKIRFLLPLLLIALPFQGCTCTSVQAGHVGIKKVWGEVEGKPLPPGGPYMFAVWSTNIEQVSARIQKMEVSASASSKDLQVVTTKLALNFRLKKDKIGDIYDSIGNLDAVSKTIIQPAIQESLKKGTAEFTAEELVTKRKAAKEAITQDITATLAKNNIVVTEVSVTDFQFDKKYQNAVEAKQVAEQKAQQASNDLARIKVEAEQAEARAAGKAKAMLTAAKAEAEAQALLRKTVTPEIVQLRAIEKWNGVQPQVVSGSGGGTIIDLASFKGK